MKAIDHTGKVYGASEVLGRGPEPNTWRTQCTNCGTITVRSAAGLRGIKANAAQYRGCSACKHTYMERRPGMRGFRPRSETNEGQGDIGVLWKDGNGFESTEIGRMQQRFYLRIGLE
jgi:hypothetical protein